MTGYVCFVAHTESTGILCLKTKDSIWLLLSTVANSRPHLSEVKPFEKVAHPRVKSICTPSSTGEPSAQPTQRARHVPHLARSRALLEDALRRPHLPQRLSLERLRHQPAHPLLRGDDHPRLLRHPSLSARLALLPQQAQRSPLQRTRPPPSPKKTFPSSPSSCPSTTSSSSSTASSTPAAASTTPATASRSSSSTTPPTRPSK